MCLAAEKHQGRGRPEGPPDTQHHTQGGSGLGVANCAACVSGVAHAHQNVRRFTAVGVAHSWPAAATSKY